jgi:1-phosphofructokinase family hexose kinase
MLIFDGFRLGEVNRAREAYWCSSGKVLNVGLALHHLGGPSLTLALVGGLPGRQIDRELQSLGVPRRWVESRRATRVCTTVLDSASGMTTELVENAAPVEADEIEQFYSAYEEVVRRASRVVLSGSLPAGAPKTFYRDLLQRASCPVVLDARGPELLEALPLKPWVVKPNREELGKTFGRQLRTDGELKEAILEAHRLGAQWVVVSHGKSALWASGEGKIHILRPAAVRTVNPIGCGDCLAAGIAWAARSGLSMLEGVRFGMACAAENAAELLPGRLDLERVRRRMEDVKVESDGGWRPAARG